MQELEAVIDTIQKRLKDRPCKDSIREAFQACDRDASGYVDKEMFFEICGSLNVPVDDSLIKEVSMGYCSGLIVEAGHRSSLLKAVPYVFCSNWGRSKIFQSDLLLGPDCGFPLILSLAFFLLAVARHVFTGCGARQHTVAGKTCQG